ncbi:MAG: hypothetical protein R2838_03770 [Caldilineaceae bacterium]
MSSMHIWLDDPGLHMQQGASLSMPSVVNADGLLNSCPTALPLFM